MQDITEELLGKCYRENVLRSSDPKPFIDMLHKRFEANQNLRSEAQEYLATLTDQVTLKCFVSKKKREYLTQALEGLE